MSICDIRNDDMWLIRIGGLARSIFVVLMFLAGNWASLFGRRRLARDCLFWQNCAYGPGLPSPVRQNFSGFSFLGIFVSFSF